MYELTILLNEETELEPLKKILESVKGTLVKETKWGSRKLAYPIDKQTAAFYYTWSIDLEKSQVAELKKKLNFHEKLLRYLLLESETK